MKSKLPKNKQLILFDGICNLCNSSVLFIIKRDYNDCFRFASLQGELGQDILKAHNLCKTQFKSILLYTADDKLSFKSTAILKIAKRLKFPWNLSAVFLIVPQFIRNFVYDLIAKHRYQWFGKKDYCELPSKHLNSKFLN